MSYDNINSFLVKKNFTGLNRLIARTLDILFKTSFQSGLFTFTNLLNLGFAEHFEEALDYCEKCEEILAEEIVI